MSVSVIGSPIFLLMDLSNILSSWLNSCPNSSFSNTEQTVDPDKSWNLAKYFEICSGMTVNHISCPTSFSIPNILPILTHLSTPEAGYQYQHCSYKWDLTYSYIYVVLESISSLGVILSSQAFYGRYICYCIPEWYTNYLSQSCRGAPYYLIWSSNSLCYCWISFSALFCNFDWGYVCYIFIPYSLSSIFLHLLILVISHAFSECRYYVTLESIKYRDKEVWASFLCVKV